VVPDALGGLQPLCAVYRREVCAIVSRRCERAITKLESCSRLCRLATFRSRRLQPAVFPLRSSGTSTPVTNSKSWAIPEPMTSNGGEGKQAKVTDAKPYIEFQNVHKAFGQ